MTTSWMRAGNAAVLGLLLGGSASAVETKSTGSEPENGAESTPAPPAQPTTALEFYQVLTDEAFGGRVTEAMLEQAEAAFIAAAKTEPTQGKWLTGQALIARALKQRERAVELSAKAVKLSPEDAEAQLYYGTCIFENINNVGFLSKMGYASDGRAAFEKAVELAPGNASARFALAQYYIGAPGIAGGSVKKARQQADELIALGGKGASLGHTLLAQLAAADEKWDEVEAQYVKAGEFAATPRDKYGLLAARASVRLTKRNDAPGGLELVEQMTPLARPNDSAHLYLGGLGRSMLGEHAEAIRLFREVLEKNPGAVNTRYSLGKSLVAMGDDAGALAIYQEFLEMASEDSRAGEVGKEVKRLKKKLGK